MNQVGLLPLPGARSVRSARLLVILAAVFLLGAGGLAISKFAEPPFVATTPPPAASTAGAPVNSEAYRWRPVAIGGGGFMVGLSSDRAGHTLVARTDVHGAYLWRPERDHWAQLFTAPAMPAALRGSGSVDVGVNGIAVAPSDGQRLYAALKGTVLYSRDRGAHWAMPQGGPFPIKQARQSEYLRYDPILAVSPDDPLLVLLGTASDGVLRSSDGGETWQRVRTIPFAAQGGNGNSPPILMWFAPPANGLRQVWASVPGRGMYTSRDAGATFATPALREQAPAALAAGTFAPDGTFYGADPGGRTIWRAQHGVWIDLVRQGALKPGRYVAIAANPGNGAVFAFENNGRARRSIDGGKTWQSLSFRSTVGHGDPPWLRIANRSFFATAQVRFDSVVPDRLWIAAGTGMFRADVPNDATRIDWISQTRGIEELVTNDVVQQHGHPPLFAAWDFGIHVKPDLNAYSTTYGPRERVLIAAQQLALTPADADFVVTNASDTRDCCAEDGNAVLAGYSRDAGRTWRKFATLPQPPGTKAGDPWRMAFGTIAVSSNDPENIVWMPSLDRAPFYTRDLGRSWRQVHFPGEHPPFTGSHRAKHLQRKVLVADPVAPATFYLAHSGNRTNPQLAGLWRTKDGGATWQKLHDGEIAPDSDNAAKLRAVPGREGQLYFTSGLPAGADTRLRFSPDGGRTWQVVPGIDRVDDIAFGKAAHGRDYPTIFLSGFVQDTYGVWRSVDHAKSWQRIADLPLGSLDRVTVLGADPDVFGRVYIGMMGSGWLYGEPAPCTPAPLEPFATYECYAVR